MPFSDEGSGEPVGSRLIYFFRLNTVAETGDMATVLPSVPGRKTSGIFREE